MRPVAIIASASGDGKTTLGRALAEPLAVSRSWSARTFLGGQIRAVTEFTPEASTLDLAAVGPVAI